MKETPVGQHYTPGRSFDEVGNNTMMMDDDLPPEHAENLLANSDKNKQVERTEEDTERRLRISFDRQYHEAHFVSDLLAQKIHLADLMAYLMILEQAEGVSCLVLPRHKRKPKLQVGLHMRIWC
jgi:hypothetical protein